MKRRIVRAAFSRCGCTRLVAVLAGGLAVGLAALTASAQHHGHYEAGDIQIMEPFATPTPPGAKIGAAYVASMANKGSQADRLLSAHSPAAGRIELHSGEIGADGVMRMRELDDVPLPPKTTLQMGPGQGNHLMLMELARPLKTGDRFPMTLEFERAGKVEVEVLVKVPAAGGRPAQKHGH